MAQHSRRLEHSLIFMICISCMKDYAMQAHKVVKYVLMLYVMVMKYIYCKMN